MKIPNTMAGIPMFPALLFLMIFAVSCSKKQEQEAVSKKDSVTCEKPEAKGGKEFEMYEMSEMAALMEQMYDKNMELKAKIEKGEKVGKFDSDFLKIHSAVMTDGKENDAFFKAQAGAFIRSQQLIYEDPANAKAHFNDAVNTCISCHQVKCTGPIARIKKLRIN